jgi:hypothetical protein
LLNGRRKIWEHCTGTGTTCLIIIIIIIIIINGKGTCMLIDVAISGDRNIIKKGAEKILKY